MSSYSNNNINESTSISFMNIRKNSMKPDLLSDVKPQINHSFETTPIKKYIKKKDLLNLSVNVDTNQSTQ